MTVIITSYSQGDVSVYHTDVCRKVREIENKRYISKERAKRIGYRECQYCSGEFQAENGSRELYNKLVEMGKANAD